MQFLKNKFGADIIAESLTQAINCYLRQGIFPDNAKIAFVVPDDKRKPDKFDVSNYRPVSILNSFLSIRKGNQKPVSVLF